MTMPAAKEQARLHNHGTRRWAFVGGEHHDAEEDRILDAIDAERAQKGGAALGDYLRANYRNTYRCVREGDGAVEACSGPVSLVRDELVCRAHRAEMLKQYMPHPIVGADDEAPIVRARQHRGGPYLILLPGARQQPVKVYAPTARLARAAYCRMLKKPRLPKGTKVWRAP